MSFQHSAVITRQETASIRFIANATRTTRPSTTRPHVTRFSAATSCKVDATTTHHGTAAPGTTNSARVILIGRRRTAIARVTTSADCIQAATATTWNSTAADTPSMNSATPG